MIGLDTNVLVRFLVQDEPRQAARADSLMAQLSPSSPGYLSTVVLVETYWVLRSAYRQKPEAVVDVLGELVGNACIVTQDRAIVLRALTLAADGADLPDAILAEAGRAAGCASVASFDKGAQRSLGFTSP
ncbi:type II toxin-antitoxin system VapC family toxin [Janibacter terrae]|uniref:PIN domain-containing protein n=1 Tax=Janibacter terrae TaxID=103817 RepID=UPI0031F80494